MTDMELLRQTIDDKGVKFSYIAEKIGLSRQGFSQKLSQNTDFKAWQMLVMVDILHLTEEESRAIFFANEVDEKSTEVTA